MNLVRWAITGVGIITVVVLTLAVFYQDKAVEPEIAEAKDLQQANSLRIYEIGILGGSGGKKCIEITDCYYPKSVTVSAGETVFWNNIDDASHTVTSGNSVDGHDGIFDSDLIFPGSTFGYVFDEVGTFDYYCILHPWMTGDVTAVESLEKVMNERVEQEITQEATSTESLPKNVTVLLPLGTSIPGCDKTAQCFVPSQITVARGTTVSWVNEDTGTHTVTSGTVKLGPTGMFDTGLFLSAETFRHAFESVGIFDYYCKVHPWMTGTVTVV